MSQQVQPTKTRLGSQYALRLPKHNMGQRTYLDLGILPANQHNS